MEGNKRSPGNRLQNRVIIGARNRNRYRWLRGERPQGLPFSNHVFQRRNFPRLVLLDSVTAVESRERLRNSPRRPGRRNETLLRPHYSNSSEGRNEILAFFSLIHVARMPTKTSRGHESIRELKRPTPVGTIALNGTYAIEYSKLKMVLDWVLIRPGKSSDRSSDSG